MKALKTIGKALGVLAGIIILSITAALWYYRDIPMETLEARYGAPESQFITIDGVRIHYRDEGPRDGPPVLLLHAHWGSLIMWDDWANILKDKYRVIRFDMAGHGLTGIDPTGDYTLERGVALMEQFNEALGIERFDIVGTSLGGTHAIHYTVKHPSQINRLVLLNPGALNAGVRGRDTPRGLPWWVSIMTYITPQQLFQFMLEGGYGSANDVDETIVRRWHEMQMGEGHRPAELARTSQYISGDIVSMIKSIQSPTLIMWGEDNPVVTVDQAYEFMDLLERAPEKQLAVFTGLGHMAVLEDPEVTSIAIKDYLEGTRVFTDHLK
ncbi:MAG: alpha/beta hydrolase [Rhodospirillaceae bacterium]